MRSKSFPSNLGSVTLKSSFEDDGLVSIGSASSNIDIFINIIEKYMIYIIIPFSVGLGIDKTLNESAIANNASLIAIRSSGVAFGILLNNSSKISNCLSIALGAFAIKRPKITLLN